MKQKYKENRTSALTKLVGGYSLIAIGGFSITLSQAQPVLAGAELAQPRQLPLAPSSPTWVTVAR
ncbi:MAG: hypothetical protein IPI20_20270 [Rhodoferax sp.]|nr:hypothetical protein [Rhodoferax sp.]